MKKLLAIAALLLASTAAQAQYTFEYGGRTIRVDPDRGTVSIPGVYDNSGRKAKRSRNDDTDRSRSKTPQQAKTDPQQPATDAAAPAATAPAPSEQAAAPAATAPVAATPASQPRRLNQRPQRQRPRLPIPPTTPPPAPPAPPVQQEAAPVAKPAPGTGRRRRAACTGRPCSGAGSGSGRELAARPVADGREGRQGQDRAVRRQSLRLFGRQEIEPERRTGSDQHEARQGRQMERPDPRSRIPAAPMIRRSR